MFPRTSMVVAVLLGQAAVFDAALGASLFGKLKLEPKVEVTKINVNPVGDPEPGGGQAPEAVLQITSALVEISDPLPNALAVTRGTLPAQRAYGLGLPNGYTAPPPNNPDGPWQGLMWPYRDFNDGYAGRVPAPPAGNDVGLIDLSGASSGRYFVRQMIGEMAYDINDPTTYRRGVFVGDTDEVQFFKIELESLVETGREITVSLRAFSAVLLLRDESGRLFTQEFNAPDTTITLYIPSPSSAGLLALSCAGLAARRRRA